MLMSHKSTDPGRVLLKHALSQSSGVVIVFRAVVCVMTRPHEVDFCHQHKSQTLSKLQECYCLLKAGLNDF